MPEGLDHIVHAVCDLDAVGDVYAQAGFIVGVRNRHPWGTHNRIVQMESCYIELLTVAEPDKIPPRHGRTFPFGAFNQDFLCRRQGLSMFVLKSSDTAADHRSFEAAGIGGFDMFEFAREGVKPDGEPVRLAFSLAFAADPSSPELGFAVCRNHYPGNFWDPAFQQHTNGVRRVRGVVMVAESPADCRRFLKSFTGVNDLRSSPAGITARTGNGDIEIMTAAAFHDLAGVSPVMAGGMTLNAIRFEVADIAKAAAAIGAGGIAAHTDARRVVVRPDAAFGATLIFETAKEG
jgi:Glyoxalase-like domain